MIQFMKNEALVIDNSQLNTSAPLPEESVSYGYRECDCETRTVQVQVSQQQSCSTCNDKRPNRPSLRIDASNDFRNELLVGHGSQHSGCEIDGFSCNSKNTDDHAGIHEISNAFHAGICDSEDERRGGDTAATKETFVIRGNKKSDEDDLLIFSSRPFD